MRPNKQDHIAYFEYYINLVPENDILSALNNNHQTILEFLKSIPADKAEYKYAEGKWTIKQVLNHIIDTERIFSYRALRFSRGDNQVLASYDENLYAANVDLSRSSLDLLIEEFDAVRKATLLQFSQLSEKELLLKGKTTSGENNVLSIAYVICGHATHHVNVIKERYLI
jgi:uncharacterized damage-inducible protein DinB